MMYHYEGKHISDETAIAEGWVRREQPFYQIFTHIKTNQRLSDYSCQRTSCCMHTRRIRKEINHKANQKRKDNYFGLRCTNRQFDNKIQIQEWSSNTQKMDIVQYQNLNQYQYNKIKDGSNNIVNHFALPPSQYSFVRSDDNY